MATLARTTRIGYLNKDDDEQTAVQLTNHAKFREGYTPKAFEPKDFPMGGSVPFATYKQADMVISDLQAKRETIKNKGEPGSVPTPEPVSTPKPTLA